jgi:hypothetical protein
MKFVVALAIAVVLALTLGAASGAAHHPISAKFDDTKPLTLTGVVTLVDWRNPHVHIYMNVRRGNDADNWAVELESPIDLQAGGWNRDSVQPGNSITVTGISARNGSRQVWANRIVMTGTGRQVLNVPPPSPPALLQNRPTPKWADGQPRLGPAPGGVQGYWAFPSSTVLAENGSNVQMDQYGLLRNVADARRVAPMQPWALALYELRQRRFLQDDPTAGATPDRLGAMTIIRSITAGRWENGRATRWWWTPGGSTRTSGSPTADCHTPSNCGWSSASRARTSTR